MRVDGRGKDRLRPVSIVRDYIMHAEGSVLIATGNTKVICTASVEDRVPPFKKGTGEGWVTAEYSMLPRSTNVRNQRDITRLRMNGRGQEIQRLIGRAFRPVVDLILLGERQITIDCDVIQADGGTRTASITGAFVALADACDRLVKDGVIERTPLTGFVAATSVGIVSGEALLDLCYNEDSSATVDMNVVMDDKGRFIEVQATGEREPFGRDQLDKLLSLAERGIKELIVLQRETLGDIAFGTGRDRENEETGGS